MPRLFVAVWPSEDVVSELMALPRKDQKGVRFVVPESWHVTLRFLGEAEPDEVMDAMGGTALPATTARFGPAVDVIAERALVVPVAGVEELAAAVRGRTAHLGQLPPKRRFVGHVTLARVKPNVPMPRALGAMVEAEMPVEEVALVQSRLDPDRARYDTLTTWPVASTFAA